MIMDETTAKAKSCPITIPNALFCQASGCMMWRWAEPPWRPHAQASIKTLNLSRRVESALLSAGINSIGQLAEKDALNLSLMSGLASRSIHEIKDALKGMGITLGEKIADGAEGRKGFCGLAGNSAFK